MSNKNFVNFGLSIEMSSGGINWQDAAILSKINYSFLERAGIELVSKRRISRYLDEKEDKYERGRDAL